MDPAKDKPVLDQFERSSGLSPERDRNRTKTNLRVRDPGKPLDWTRRRKNYERRETSNDPSGFHSGKDEERGGDNGTSPGDISLNSRGRGRWRGRGRRGRMDSGSWQGSIHRPDHLRFRSGMDQNRREPPLRGDGGFGDVGTDRRTDKERHGRVRPTSDQQGMKPLRGRTMGERKAITTQGLEELLHHEPNDILLSIASSRSSVLSLFNQLNLKEDMIVLIIRVVSKACHSSHSPQNLLTLLTSLIQSHFLLNSVTRFLLNMSPIQISDMGYNKALMDSVHLCQKLLRLLPSSSIEPVTILLVHFQQLLNKDISSSTVFREEIEKLEREKDDVVKQMQVGELMRDQERKDKHTEEEPPDDFRQIAIIPTPQDIRKDDKPFIRKNIVFGSYTSVDHYLDIQFRLLREDFLAPLRQGIQELLASEKQGKFRNKFQDIKVYEHAHIQEPICINKGIVHAVSFDVSMLSRIRWENSKRLIHGSLLCFSKNNFRTILFGTVAERDPEKLVKGIIYVQFEDLSMQHMDVGPFDEFRIVESPAYFEAYRHNLEGLQEIQEDSLPFKKYILNNDAKEVDSPRYLRGRGVSYDFKCLMPKEAEDLHKFEDIPVMDRKAWPSAEELDLDQSQFNALQSAITKEFCVIQGPPGTGKTFIGLKIVQLLLKNKAVWNEHRKPILIVCYTNHALDQFLEGILSFNGKHGICRIGGGGSSENTNLKACRLSNLKKDHEFRESVPRNIKNASSALREEMEVLQKQIGHMASAVQWARKGIIHEQYLQHLMTLSQSESLMSKQYQDSIMVQWLWPDKGQHKNVEDYAQADLDEGGEKPSDNPHERENEDDEELVQEELNKRMVGEEEHESVSKLHDKMQKDAPHANQGMHYALTLQPGNNNSQREFVCKSGETMEDEQWQKVNKRPKKDFQRLKHNLQGLQIMTEDEYKQVADVWTLSDGQRWKLYRYWVSQYCMEIVMRMRYLKDEYSQKTKQLDELRMEEDFLLIRHSTIIGMTTTGAAKYRQVLHRVQPRIVIVEEAAEVLESHIVTTISMACEHLILIGDHQQLRPNPTVYKLAKDYHLDISLFERMVKNGMHCDRLGIQHRMRPEISRLIVPHVYKELADHESVFKYENIKGISGNIYLIDHNVQEEHVEDTKSRSNLHEAEFLAALCRYFLQQGYSTSQITVLTTYTGQMFQLRNLMPRDQYEGVRITPVDNYQGEENDIILLSLVRSNEEGKIGFLSVSNRVCVALSRAKKGFFAIGNTDLLAKSSNLWLGIINELRREGKVVKALPLACQNHPESVVEARVATDFKNAPEGGCTRPCEYRLNCGHACKLKCHPRDPDHLEYVCRKPCTKIICERNHVCPGICFEKCQECSVPVEKEMPICKHIETIACYMDPATFCCTFPCEKVLVCGHSCMKLCGEPCEEECKVVVKDREWPCGHKLSTYCHRNPTNYKCHEEITHKLSCGHLVTMYCHEDPTYYECREEISRHLPCGHNAILLCMSKWKSHSCTAKITKELACGHAVEIQCYQRMVDTTCKEKLEIQCLNNPKHKYYCSCCDRENAKCPLMCGTVLSCGHPCRGKCGECESINHPPCQNFCSRFLPCGHVCGQQCGKPCPPCRSPCSTFCGHSLCRWRCGNKCYRCDKRCSWRCMHYQCDHICCDPCNRPPCNAPCPRVLHCGHYCMGLCGEPCPPICGICWPNYINQIAAFLKVHLTPRSRFLHLRPCGHTVEVSAMDNWMDGQDSLVPRVLKHYECPICRVILAFCPRYGNKIKQRRREMEAAKETIRNQLYSDDIIPEIAQKHVNHFSAFQKMYSSYFYDIASRRGCLALACAKLFHHTIVEAHAENLISSHFSSCLGHADRKLSSIVVGEKEELEKLQDMKIYLKLLYTMVQVMKIKNSVNDGNRKTLPYAVVSRLQSAAERASDALNDEIVDLEDSGIKTKEVEKLREKTLVGPVYYHRMVDSRIRYVSEIIVGNFRPYQRYNIDDFLNHVNRLIPSDADRILDKKWLVCGLGHTFCVDRQGQETTCSVCHPPPQQRETEDNPEEAMGEETAHSEYGPDQASLSDVSD